MSKTYTRDMEGHGHDEDIGRPRGTVQRNAVYKCKSCGSYADQHDDSHCLCDGMDFGKPLGSAEIVHALNDSLAGHKVTPTTPREALFAFMGWLTSRDNVSGPFSSRHNATQAADLVAAYSKHQGWDEIADDWTNKIKSTGNIPVRGEDRTNDAQARVHIRWEDDPCTLPQGQEQGDGPKSICGLINGHDGRCIPFLSTKPVTQLCSHSTEQDPAP